MGDEGVRDGIMRDGTMRDGTMRDGAVWVFGYGSLLWSPGFEPAEAVRARLDGWRRRFCMWSIHWRGTPHAPGLVLALDAEAGAACEGLALRLPAGEAAEILAAIRARELVSDAYEERRLPLALADGRRVEALAYVSRRDHPQHADLPPGTQARVIAQARGERGPNRDYLALTAERLRALGIEDAEMEALLRAVEAHGAGA